MHVPVFISTPVANRLVPQSSCSITCSKGGGSTTCDPDSPFPYAKCFCNAGFPFVQCQKKP